MRPFLSLSAFALLSFASAYAGCVDWSTGSWNNGSGYNAGYDGGSTSGTTISNGVTVVTSYGAFNLTPRPENLYPTNVINGANANGDDPALLIYVGGDSNTGSTLTDYSRLTLSFSQAVTLSSALTIFDVDQTVDPVAGYNDYIVVRARIGGPTGTTVGITYTPTGTNQIAGNDYGLAGMRANNGLVAQDSSAGNVLIDTAGAFDYLEIYFTQAVGNVGGVDHAIGISDLNFSVVPEPQTNALLALGFGFVLCGGAKMRKIRALADQKA